MLKPFSSAFGLKTNKISFRIALMSTAVGFSSVFPASISA
jgi:hypothetical protein